MTTQNIYDLADTWNDAGTTYTAIKMDVTDTASNAASLLIDLQVGGASKFSVRKNGQANFTGALMYVGGTTHYFRDLNTDNPKFYNGVNNCTVILGRTATAQSGLFVTSNGTEGIGWLSGNYNNAADVILNRDAANTLALRNSTNAQAFRVYNTYTDASNYERGVFRWNSNRLEIGTEFAGTGARRIPYLFARDGTGSYSAEAGVRLEVDNGSASKTLAFKYVGGFSLMWGVDTTYYGHFSSDGFMLGTTTLGWNNGTPQNTADTTLTRDGAADTLALRRSTNAQAFNIYNTYTDASNYERGFVKWTTNTLQFGMEVAGTGTARTVQLARAGTVHVQLENARTVLLASPSIGNGHQLAWSNGTNWSRGIAPNAAGGLAITNGSTGGESLELREITAPSAPSANAVYLYAEDNGAGKTRLMAVFPSGAAQQIAIEP